MHRSLLPIFTIRAAGSRWGWVSWGHARCPSADPCSINSSCGWLRLQVGSAPYKTGSSETAWILNLVSLTHKVFIFKTLVLEIEMSSLLKGLDRMQSSLLLLYHQSQKKVKTCELKKKKILSIQYCILTWHTFKGYNVKNAYLYVASEHIKKQEFLPCFGKIFESTEQKRMLSFYNF